MNINLNSIMGKVHAYSRTDEGKRRMKDYIDQCVADEREKTYGGSDIITTDVMRRAAYKLIDCLQAEANSIPLPASVRAHFASLDCTDPAKMSDGHYEIAIYFEDDLHRDSLVPEDYDGVPNIVALLNNGYHAKDYVYGFWDRHRPTTTNNILRSGPMSDFAYVRSMKEREGLHFINQVISDFNGNYGSLYNATAIAGEDYR